jgi:ABC-type bacteriocin/lantibiotic exporter with double-glycine peptidase domain
MVLQSTPYTCMPAAIANILRRHGITKTEAELALLMGTSQEGTSTGRAALELQRLGLKATKKSVPDRNVAALVPPAILLMDSDAHVVVYFGLSNQLAQILDPSSGWRAYKMTQLAARWTGRALEVQR